jgi:hypothetical protein
MASPTSRSPSKHWPHPSKHLDGATLCYCGKRYYIECLPEIAVKHEALVRGLKKAIGSPTKTLIDRNIIDLLLDRHG